MRIHAKHLNYYLAKENDSNINSHSKTGLIQKMKKKSIIK